MTDKQQVFVNYYCGEAAQNASKAFVMAGYSKIGADANAHRLIVKDSIKAAIADKMALLAKKAGYTQEIGLAKLLRAYDLAEKCRQPSAMVQAVIGANRMHGFDKDANIGEKTVIIIRPRISEQPKPIKSKEISNVKDEM